MVDLVPDMHAHVTYLSCLLIVNTVGAVSHKEISTTPISESQWLTSSNKKCTMLSGQEKQQIITVCQLYTYTFLPLNERCCLCGVKILLPGQLPKSLAGYQNHSESPVRIWLFRRPWWHNRHWTVALCWFGPWYASTWVPLIVLFLFKHNRRDNKHGYG